MLENRALAEVLVSELISSKSASGHGCSTCGGCTVKRRASAEADNASARAEASRRKQAKGTQQADDEVRKSEQSDADDAKRRRRRRRRPKKSRPIQVTEAGRNASTDLKVQCSRDRH